MEPAKEDFKLVEFGEKEGKEVMASVEAIMKQFNGTIVAIPIILPNGTLGASVQVFKKVPTTKVEDAGILSPKDFQNGGESTTQKTD